MSSAHLNDRLTVIRSAIESMSKAAELINELDADVSGNLDAELAELPFVIGEAERIIFLSICALQSSRRLSIGVLMGFGNSLSLVQRMHATELKLNAFADFIDDAINGETVSSVAALRGEQLRAHLAANAALIDGYAGLNEAAKVLAGVTFRALQAMQGSTTRKKGK